ncbi:MAG: hypothetical protein WC755_03880 [Candidatus Woesearchaeota archaeon]|jgi:hypothetical protein
MKRNLVVWVSLVFVFFSWICVCYSDIFDEYDYTSGISVNYSLKFIDTDFDFLFDYVNITVNDSRAIVSLNEDVGKTFYPYSLIDGENEIDISIRDGNTGFVLYDKTFNVVLNLSLFDAGVSGLNVLHDIVGSNIIIDSGIDSNVVFYFDDFSISSFRIGNVSSSYCDNTELHLKKVYVSSLNHLFDVNYTIDCGSFLGSVNGIYAVFEEYSNYTLYLNVSCNNISDLNVKVYSSEVSLIYSEDISESCNFIYAINSSKIYDGRFNGPFNVYFDNYLYETNEYSYVEFSRDYFEDIVNSSSTFENLNDSSDSSGSNNVVSLSSKGGGSGGGGMGNSVLLPLISDVVDDVKDDILKNDTRDNFYIIDNYFSFDFNKSVVDYLYLVDLVSGNTKKSVDFKNGVGLDIGNSITGNSLFDTNEEDILNNKKRSIDVSYIKKGIILFVFFLIVFATIYFVRKKIL